MQFTWFDTVENTISFIVEGSLLLVLSIALSYTFFRVSKRKAPLLMFILMECSVLFTFVFQLLYSFIVTCLVVTLISFFVFMANIGDVRKFFANPFKRSKTEKSTSIQKIIDKKSLFLEIQKAVVGLSDKHVGALITFEKNTNLNEICKNGVAVNAPFTKELIDTIFYPGTRLHDGAVIVKDGYIETASVFYTPTTKPFAVKYGSRHRAALGISEISDAVTIVVSEETGLVSIAYEGSIEHVEADRLAITLNNYF